LLCRLLVAISLQPQPTNLIAMTTPTDSRLLHVLLAPEGQLSGDGQLRELIAERRDRRGPDAPLWHLSPELVRELYLASGGQEAVVADDEAVITWLQLRFGGRTKTAVLSPELLRQRASALPPRAPQAAVDLS
jgi:hypothetical protein